MLKDYLKTISKSNQTNPQKMKYLANALIVSIFIFLSLSLNAQCPGCVIDLPQLPADTVYLADAPDGEAGVYYDNDLSFRLPITTDPVNALDPSIPAGLDISDIKILAVVNLPPGLNYEPNQTDFDPNNETDGCVCFCGTPLQSGLYEMLVVLEAKISVLTQTASYPIEIYIAPAVSTTDGFTMSNTTGCGEVLVEFGNNVPSNGDTGFSYIWDFGNGFTSNLENPGFQIYDEPGTYFINYDAFIDTIPPTLTNVNILDVDCDDLIGDADIFIKIKDPSGATIFETSPVNNTPIPISIAVNLPLGVGTYKLEVRDDDPFGNANCGDVTFNVATTGTIIDGGLEVSFDIFKPVFMVSSTDTVVVLELPETPELNITGDIEVCSNELVELEVLNYTEYIQWYRDSSLLFGDTLPNLTVSLPGIYWAEYIDKNGCEVVSEIANIEEIAAPGVPTFSSNSNLLTLNDSDNLPDNYSINWYLEGELIDDSTGVSLVIWESGEYTVEVIDEDSGCSTSFSFGAAFDPTLASEEVDLLQSQVSVYPNPTNGAFWVSMTFDETKEVIFEIFDVTGRVVLRNPIPQIINSTTKNFDLTHFEEGTYFLRMIVDDLVVTKRILKL